SRRDDRPSVAPSGADRHGLRASELCDLQWHQVEINTGRLHVRRSKKGTPSVHPMQGDEIRALRRLQREQEASPYVFTSERGGPMSAKSFGTLFERLGKRAGMPFTIFPHMLRHACGYALANAGHDTRALQAWLGHKNIQLTVLFHGSSERLDQTRTANEVEAVNQWGGQTRGPVDNVLSTAARVALLPARR